MIISRESRKSRKIIHRYRSYVAVQKWQTRVKRCVFRVIREILVRKKQREVKKNL